MPAGIAVGVHFVLLTTMKILRIHDHSTSYLNTEIMTTAYRPTMKEVQLLIMLVASSRFFNLFVLAEKRSLATEWVEFYEVTSNDVYLNRQNRYQA